MPRARKLFLSIIGIVVLAVSLYLLQRAMTQSQADGQTVAGPAVLVANPKLVLTDHSGSRVWEITAESLTVDATQAQALGQQVNIVLYEQGRAELAITADRLVLNQRTQDFSISGKVSGRGNGLAFWTDEAHWDARRRLLHGDARVRVERDGLSLEGQGFSYRPDQGTLTIHQDVRLQIRPAPAK